METRDIEIRNHNPTKIIKFMEIVTVLGFVIASMISLNALYVWAAIFGAISAAMLMKAFAAGAGGMVGAKFMKQKKTSEYIISVTCNVIVSVIFSGAIYAKLHKTYDWITPEFVYGGMAIFGVPLVLVLLSFVTRSQQRAPDVADAGANAIIDKIDGKKGKKDADR